MGEGAHKLSLPSSLLDSLKPSGETSGTAIIDGRSSVYLYADERFLALSPETHVLGRSYRDVWPELVAGCACSLALTVSPLEHEGVLYGLVTAEMRSPQPERRAAREASEESLVAELERTRRSHERTVVLREVALASAGTTDLHSLAAGILEVFERRLGADQGTMFLFEDGVMYELGSFGRCTNVHGIRRLRGNNLLVEAVRSGGRLTHEDPLPPQLLKRTQKMRLDHERWIILPIESSGEVLGGLGVTFPGRRPFTDDEISLYEAIEQQLGVAMEKVMLFEELRETTRLGDALNDINEVLLRSKERREIIERTGQFACDVLGCDTHASLEVTADGLVPLSAVGIELSELEALAASVEKNPGVKWSATQQDVLAVEDVTRDRRVDGPLLSSWGLSSVLVLALSLRQRRFGMIGFGYLKPHAFTDAEIDFAQKLATAVSLALESARLYENERFIAETLQESLLSLPSQVEGIEIAHLYSSATDTARVGGDFYDVFELAHGNVGVLIGDVSGKGVDAAVLTSLVKNTLRAHSVTPGRTPAQIVSMTSEEVHRRTAPESYVTLLFGILDRRDGRLAYCNAGHTSGCIRRTNGEMHSLPANSPIVGAFSAAHFTDSEAYLDCGDELWLYTDGLTEARVGSVQFGEERLSETLKASEGDSLDRRLGDLLGEVVHFAHGQLSDDIAMLVLRRVAQPHQALQQKFDYRQLWG